MYLSLQNNSFHAVGNNNFTFCLNKDKAIRKYKNNRVII